jgi:DNA-binding MarR family transcriptional regulator
MSESPSRKLTPRQSAVLAALERRGTCVLPDLRADFPHLAPSVVLRVIDALQRKGLVSRAGNAWHVYLGGVMFWVPPRSEAESA